MALNLQLGIAFVLAGLATLLIVFPILTLISHCIEKKINQSLLPTQDNLVKFSRLLIIVGSIIIIMQILTDNLLRFPVQYFK
jgi:hypothetical protein